MNFVGSSLRFRYAVSGAALVACLIANGSAVPQTLPNGGTVTHGTASIGAPQAGTLNINQTSNRAIIDWSSFSVGAGGRVNFNQPGASAATLNRVTGTTSSTIAGNITAPGTVLLVNPNGIAITPTGTVNVGSFAASTLDIKNSDFLAGNYKFTGNGSSATVTNAGRINVSDGGFAALLGGRVANDGIISARLGRVGLGSGEKITLDLSGDGFLQVEVPSNQLGNIVDGTGQALVSNRGKIRANGGVVHLSAATASTILRDAVNVPGSIRANSVGTRNGRIVLGGGEGGRVSVSGRLAANGRSRGTAGGRVDLSGMDISMTGARIDVSGDTGGGLVRVGGAFQGGNSDPSDPLYRTFVGRWGQLSQIASARNVTIDASTRIDISARTQGNGGTAIVWSNQSTSFAGSIYGSGGAYGGNGGSAEVSGAAMLAYTGQANLLAANGSAGTLLLDPFNLTIGNGSTTGMSGFTAIANDSFLNVATLTANLAGANIEVRTISNSGSQTGNITVAAPISWSANTVLTLTARRDIFINADITATGSSAGVMLNPGQSGTGTYTLGSGVRINLPGANASFSANGETYTVINSYTALQAVAAGSMSERYVLGSDIDASASATVAFEPIGNRQNFLGNIDPFAGTFDGLGHSVRNLVINRPNQNGVGLFANLGNDQGEGTVRNFGVINATITGYDYVGAIAGFNRGRLTGAFSSGSVSGHDTVGGAVGFNTGPGSVTRSGSSANVSGQGTGAGGLVGYNDSSFGISQSFATGAVIGNTQVGGLVGQNYSGIQDSYATGAVAGNSFVGGFVGANGGTISRAYAAGQVSGPSGANVSGFAGSSCAGCLSSAFFDGDRAGVDDIQATRLTSTSTSAFGQASYTGFDFGTVWYSVDGATRPFLRAEVSSTISNARQLQLVGANLGGSFTVVADFSVANDIAGSPMWLNGFGPIGTGGAGFTGSFDGGNHTIRDLTINLPTNDNVALFGYAGVGAQISNLNITNASITGRNNVGVLIGATNGGAVSNVTVGGAVAGQSNVGGLVGALEGSVTAARADVNITATGAAAGGLAGTTTSISSIFSSYATGNVTGHTDVGGLVGVNFGSVQLSYALGRVNADGIGSAGGLIGFNGAPAFVTQTYATGAVTGSGTLGGLVGYNTGTVTSSFWDTSTSGLFSSAGGAGRTTSQLMQAATYAGWSITSTPSATSTAPAVNWFLVEGETRPFLMREYSTSITNLNQLQLAASTLGASYSLANDVVAGPELTAASNMWGGAGFAPIGRDLNSSFTGTFNGQTRSISNLVINRPLDYVGLFGVVGPTGAVSNIVMTGANFTNSGANAIGTGTIAGANYGTVTGAHVNANVVTQFAGNAGGIVGGMGPSGSITRSHAEGSVSGVNVFTFVGTGGIVGSMSTGAQVTDSYAVNAVNGANAGGIAGVSDGAILRTWASGAITGSLRVGGLVGGTFAAQSSIVNSYWDPVTSGQANAIGFSQLPMTQTNVAALQTTNSGAPNYAFNATTYSGFDFNGVWSNLGNVTRPMLRNEYSTTVHNAHQLQLVALNAGANYVLANDVDLASVLGTSAAPNMADVWGARGFASLGSPSGQFDGGGHTISGLRIDTPSQDFAALFTSIGAAGSVSNLNLTNAFVRGRNGVAILAAFNGGDVHNVIGQGTVIATGSTAGGLVSNNSGTIRQSGVTGTSVQTTGNNSGGLVGFNSGTISESFAFANATATAVGNVNIGGLVGYNTGTISQSYSIGSVSGWSLLGQLIGRNEGAVFDSYAVSMQATPAGLIGGQFGGVIRSYFDYQTSGHSSAENFARSTAELQTDVGTLGWNGGAWATQPGLTYAYLRWQFNGAPQAVSGFARDASFAPIANTSVSVMADGAALASLVTGGNATTAANGYYYVLLAPGTLSNARFAAYTSVAAPNGGVSVHHNLSGSVTNFDIVGNTLTMWGAGAVSSFAAQNAIAFGGNTALTAQANAMPNLAIGSLSGVTIDQLINRPQVSLFGAGPVVNGAVTGFFTQTERIVTDVLRLGNGTFSLTDTGNSVGTLANYGAQFASSVSFYTGGNLSIAGLQTSASTINVGGSATVSGGSSLGSTNFRAGGSINFVGGSTTQWLGFDSVLEAGNVLEIHSKLEGGGSITLRAFRDIYIEQTVTSYTNGTITINADSNGDNVGGGVYINPNLIVTNGQIDVLYNPGAYTNPFNFIGISSNPGSNNVTSYMLVNNVDQLQLIRTNLGGTYALGRDIDASATATWNPFGGLYGGFTPLGGGTSFSGLLDGRGHAILNFTSTRDNGSSVGNAGLFEVIGPSGVVRNLGIIGGTVRAVLTDYHAAGIAVYNYGTISNSFTVLNVSASGVAGGLVAINQPTGRVINGSWAGGTVTITGSGTDAGGLVGENYGVVYDSYSIANVSGRRYVGGLVGWNVGGVREIFTNQRFGAEIRWAYATGSVTGTTSTAYVGGLVGLNGWALPPNCCQNGSALIESTYASGRVTGPAGRAGGLVGYNEYPNHENTGTDIGHDQQNFSSAMVRYSAWDIDTTGQTSAYGRAVPFGYPTRDQDIQHVSPLSSVNSAYGNPRSITSYIGMFSADGTSYTGTFARVSASTVSTQIGDRTVLTETDDGFLSHWYIVEGMTRPFLRAEWSTNIQNAHQLQLINMNATANYTLARDIDVGPALSADPSGQYTGMWTAAGFSPIKPVSYTNSVVERRRTETGTISYTCDGGLSTCDANVTVNYVSARDLVPSFTTQNFAGTFDGQGHVIRNLRVITGGSTNAGLFETLGGIVRNVGIVDEFILAQGSGFAGAIAGYNGGTISQSYVFSEKSGDHFVMSNTFAGGLAGINNGVIERSFSDTITWGTGTSGGLVGGNGGGIIDAYAWGFVQGNVAAGGIAGNNGGGIGRVYSIAQIGTFQNGPAPIGGALVGTGNGGVSQNSYFDPALSFVGGTVGTQRTALQMQDFTTYITNYGGWDFNNVWAPPNRADQLDGVARYPVFYWNSHVLVIQAADATRSYGDTNPAFVATIAGLRSYDTAAAVTIAGYATSATPLSGVGSYNIRPLSTAPATIVGTSPLQSISSGAMIINSVQIAFGINATTPQQIVNYINAHVPNVTASLDFAGRLVLTSATGPIVLDVYSFVVGAVGMVPQTSAGPTTSRAVSSDGATYRLIFAEGTLTVTPRGLTITANDQTKTYGDQLALQSGAFTTSGLANGETIGSVTLASSGGAASVDVGSYAISASNATGGTFNASNYTISYVSGALNVTRAPVTVTAASVSSVYGEGTTFDGSEFRSSGLRNGQTIGSVTLTSSGASPTASVASSPYAIVASNATGGTFNPNNYTISYVNGALTVTRAPLTVTAGDLSAVYGNGTTFAGTEFTSSGLRNNETIGAVSLASNGASPTASVTGGTYAIVASNATGGSFNANNYTISYVNGALTVTPAPLTVTANSLSGVYGSGTTFAGTEFTSSGLRNNETIGAVSLTSSGASPTASVAGGPYAIVASNATGGTFNASNYAISYVNGALTVTRAPLIVTANDLSTVYGNGTTFAGTEFTSSGLQNNETIGAVALTSSGAVPTAPVAGSPYAILASNATGGTFNPNNYTISYVNGALTVTRAPLMVTANSLSSVYGNGTTFAGTEFTSSGLQNNETIGAVTLTSSGSSPTAPVAGNPYAIVASNAAGGTFNANNYTISYVNGALTVTRAPLTITANSLSSVYGQGTTFAGTEFTSSGLQNNETIGAVALTSSGASPTAPVAGNPYAIVASNATGGTFNTNNYTISYVNGALTVTRAPLTITANSLSRVYGQGTTFAGTEFTSSGLQNNETIGAVALTSSGASPTTPVAGSPYPIVASNATGGTFNTNNYTISYVNGALTVTRAPLTITANNLSSVYGQGTTFAGTEFTSVGLQNGETIGTVALASTGAAPTATVAGGPYTITAGKAAGGTFDANNYTINYATGLLTITPASLTVTANGGRSIYGQSPVNPGLSATGLQNGEDVSVLTGLTNSFGITNLTNARSYTLNVNGVLTNSNYAVADRDTGTWTVDPAAVTVTANGGRSIYGQSPTDPGFSAIGLQNGEGVGVLTGLANTFGITNLSGAGGHTLRVGGTLTNGNYTIAARNQGIWTVDPAHINVTANGGRSIYGQSPSDPEFSATGLQNGETVAALTGLSNSFGINGQTNAGSHTLRVAGILGNPNYVIDNRINGLWTIDRAALTVTANPQSRLLSEPDQLLTYRITTGQLFNGDVFTGGLSRESGTAPGFYAITQGSLATSSNYTLSYVGSTLEIRALPQDFPSQFTANAPTTQGNVTTVSFQQPQPGPVTLGTQTGPITTGAPSSGSSPRSSSSTSTPTTSVATTTTTDPVVTATVNTQQRVLTYLPISQFEPREYTGGTLPGYEERTGEATVLTMIARAIAGEQTNTLFIDNFWSTTANANAGATEFDLIGQRVTFSDGQGKTIDPEKANPFGLQDNDPAKLLQNGPLMIVSTAPNGQSWMLALRLTEDGKGIIANDPSTGRQVTLAYDPETRAIGGVRSVLDPKTNTWIAIDNAEALKAAGLEQFTSERVAALQAFAPTGYLAVGVN